MVVLAAELLQAQRIIDEPKCLRFPFRKDESAVYGLERSGLQRWPTQERGTQSAEAHYASEK